MFRRRLRQFAVVTGIALGLIILWAITYRPPTYPPPVLVSINAQRTPLNVTPGIGGVLFVLPDGSLWRWGRAGQASIASVPERIGDDADWVQATPGNNGIVGVKRDGTLWQAGWVANGVVPGNQPRQIDADTNWIFATRVDVAAAALKRDGTLWTWGEDSGKGSLGEPGVTSRQQPTQVGTERWRCITGAGSNYGFLGVTEDGQLLAWGQPHQPASAYPKPTPVLTDRRWEQASLNLFLDDSRTLWTGPTVWQTGLAGTNTIARTADNASLDRFAFTAGALFEVQTNGTLWSHPQTIFGPWGPVQKSGGLQAPAQVGDRSDWVRLWSCTGSVVGLTQDGTLWAWGTDWGAEPLLDTPSRIRKGLHDGVNFICDLLGVSRLMRNLSTTAYHRSDQTPHPLLRFAPAPSPAPAP